MISIPMSPHLSVVFVYWVTLLAFLLLAQCRGHRPWKHSIKHTETLMLGVTSQDEITSSTLSPQNQGTIKSQTTTPSVLQYGNALVHPGSPEPQTNAPPGLRGVNSIATLERTTPRLYDFQSPSSPSSPTSQPILSLPTGAAAAAVHPGYPEPHTTLTPGLRHVSSTASVPNNVGGSGSIPLSQHDDIHRWAASVGLSPHTSSPDLRSASVSPEPRGVTTHVGQPTRGPPNALPMV